VKVKLTSEIKPIVLDLRKSPPRPQSGTAKGDPNDYIVIVHHDPNSRHATSQFWLGLKLLLRTFRKRITRQFSIINRGHEASNRSYLAQRGDKHRS
jgi:hypothetical protein